MGCRLIEAVVPGDLKKPLQLDDVSWRPISVQAHCKSGEHRHSIVLSLFAGSRILTRTAERALFIRHENLAYSKA